MFKIGKTRPDTNGIFPVYGGNGIIEYIAYDFKKHWGHVSELIKDYLINMIKDK